MSCHLGLSKSELGVSGAGFSLTCTRRGWNCELFAAGVWSFMTSQRTSSEFLVQLSSCQTHSPPLPFEKCRLMAPLAVGFDCPLGQGLGVPGTSVWEAVAEDPVGMGRETQEHRPPPLCLREVHLWNVLFFFFFFFNFGGKKEWCPRQSDPDSGHLTFFPPPSSVRWRSFWF